MWQGYWWAGQACKSLLDIDGAKKFFSQLLNPSHSTIHHQGYRGLVEIAEYQREYETMLDLALQCQKDFPSLWQGYFWAGKAYQYLKDTWLAKEQFELAIAIDPNQVQPYESFFTLSDVSQEDKLSIAQKYKINFPTKWFGYYKVDEISAYINHKKNLESELKAQALKDNATIHNHLLIINFYNYIKDMKNLKEAILNVSHYPEHYLYWQAKYYYQIGHNKKSQKILYTLIHKYPTYIQGYHLLITILKQNNLQKKLLKIHHLCTKIFVGLYRGISYSDNKFFCEIKNHYLSYIKKSLELPEMSVYQKNMRELSYLNKMIDSGANNCDLRARKIELLLISNDAFEAEREFLRLKNDYGEILAIDKLECVICFHKKDYEKLHDLCAKFIQKYPESSNVVIFYYIASLFYLNKRQEIPNVYRDFLLNEKAHNQAQYITEGVINLHAQILSNSNNLPVSHHSSNQIVVSERAFVKIIENDINYPVLYLCFSGLMGVQLTELHTDFEIGEVVEKYLSYVNKQDDDFPYLGFAKQSTHANFIIFKDLLRSSHLINLEQILSIIQKQIEYFNPKYIVCTGGSAGGLASIVVGNMIKANMVFSFAPRQPFIMNNTAYPKLIQEHYDITNPNLIDISYIQRFNRGFYPKTYIALCENNVCDVLSISGLDLMDKNLNISYCYGDNHGVQSHLGTKAVFQEMDRIVQMELEHNFTLPVQQDFLANIPAFKYNNFGASHQ